MGHLQSLEPLFKSEAHDKPCKYNSFSSERFRFESESLWNSKIIRATGKEFIPQRDFIRKVSFFPHSIKNLWVLAQHVQNWSLGSSWGYSSDPSGSDRVDAIDFQTSGDVVLSGYRLWGVSSGSASFQVTIRLYRGSNLIAEKTGSYATSSSVKTFEVHFSQVISIRAGVTYTATARIVTSANSFYHRDGVASASCSGVTVTFNTSSKSSNGSSQSQGQIPVLIFRSSQC